MPKKISFTLNATYDDTRKYLVIDKICDGDTVFNGFLSKNDQQLVSSCAKDNNSDSGRISCKRSDGPLFEKDVYEGDIIDLD